MLLQDPRPHLPTPTSHTTASTSFFCLVLSPPNSIQEEPFLFLAKTSDPSVINKALLYVRDNEQTSRVLVVRVHMARFMTCT